MASSLALGVQRERNEVERTLDHIPEPRPTVNDIMTLERGWFYICRDQGYQARLRLGRSGCRNRSPFRWLADPESSEDFAVGFWSRSALDLHLGEEDEVTTLESADWSRRVLPAGRLHVPDRSGSVVQSL